MRVTGLEPAREFSHKHLKLARLPIPPYPHINATYLCTDGVANHPLWFYLSLDQVLLRLGLLIECSCLNKHPTNAWARSLFREMVGSKGLEPLHTKYQILSLARLPIPPIPHGKWKNGFVTAFNHKLERTRAFSQPTAHLLIGIFAFPWLPRWDSNPRPSG